MELTRDQENALKIAVKRYKDKEAYTVIAGYAQSWDGQNYTSSIYY